MILDFSSPIDYLWALLPEVVLAVTGLLVLALDVFQRGDRSGPSRAWVRWTAVAGVLMALLANGYVAGIEAPLRSGMIAMDGFRIGTNFVILGATLLSFLLAFDYLRREGLDVGEFYFLVLMASVGMMLLAGSRDLIVVFVSLELMSMSVYVLTGFNRRDPRSSEAALKYFLMGAFASGFLLYGIALTLLTERQRQAQLPFFESLFAAMMKITSWVIAVAPVGIFGLMAKIIANSGFAAFGPLARYGMTVLAALMLHAVVTLPLLLWLVARLPGHRHARIMAPALLTAFSTRPEEARTWINSSSMFRSDKTGTKSSVSDWRSLLRRLRICTSCHTSLTKGSRRNVEFRDSPRISAPSSGATAAAPKRRISRASACSS